MTGNRAVVVINPAVSEKRDELLGEIMHAVRQIDGAQLGHWGADVAQVTAKVGVRRVTRLGSTLYGFGGSIVSEAIGGFDALNNGKLQQHLKERAASASEAISQTALDLVAKGSTLADNFKSPDKLPATVVSIFTAFVASGGVDANGGIPDLDLQFGIDAHRSVFSHSIIAGTVVEGSVYAVATLMGLAYSKLPTQHDPIWDNINKHKDTIAQAIATGASVGIAYHLVVDGLVQEGSYHDFPFSMPQEGHNAFATANGVAEGLDARAKHETFASSAASALSQTPKTVKPKAAAESFLVTRIPSRNRS